LRDDLELGKIDNSELNWTTIGKYEWTKIAEQRL